MKRKIRIRISNVVRRRITVFPSKSRAQYDDCDRETQLVTQNRTSGILKQYGQELDEMIDRSLKDSLLGNKEDKK